MNQELLSSAGKQALRVFLVTMVVLFIPGVLGWLTDLLEWADTQGIEPFPEVEALAYLAVSALAGGIIAALTFALNLIETSLVKADPDHEED